MSAVTPEISLRASGSLRRRRLVNRIMEALGWTAALIAVGILFVVLISVTVRAWLSLSWDFSTKPPAPFGQPGGGISIAIICSLLIVAIATAIALPIGILVAIYLTEFAPRGLARPIQLVLDVLNGLPTIITGIFVFGILVIDHGQSALAAGVALSIVMLPLVARAAHETLLLVPSALREASLTLGVSRWRSVVGVILPTTFGGILTGAVLQGAIYDHLTRWPADFQPAAHGLMPGDSDPGARAVPRPLPDEWP